MNKIYNKTKAAVVAFLSIPTSLPLGRLGWACGVSLLMLSSCGLYNKYERPDSVNTQGLIRDIASDTDTLLVNSDENFGQLPWREVFTDPQLQALIDKALTQNIDLQNAALNVKMAEQQLKVANLSFLPSLAFAPSGTLSKLMMDGTQVGKTYQMPIAATWNIDLFGNLLSSKRSAQVSLLAVKDYQVAVKTGIICGVANLYYTLMMLDKQIEIESMATNGSETFAEFFF